MDGHRWKSNSLGRRSQTAVPWASLARHKIVFDVFSHLRLDAGGKQPLSTMAAWLCPDAGPERLW